VGKFPNPRTASGLETARPPARPELGEGSPPPPRLHPSQGHLPRTPRFGEGAVPGNSTHPNPRGTPVFGDCAAPSLSPQTSPPPRTSPRLPGLGQGAELREPRTRQAGPPSPPTPWPPLRVQAHDPRPALRLSPRCTPRAPLRPFARLRAPGPGGRAPREFFAFGEKKRVRGSVLPYLCFYSGTSVG
jgi:hypothetical protein